MNRAARGVGPKPSRGVVRRCKGCGKPLPADARCDALYCTHECGCASNRRRRMEAAAPQECDHCGVLFQPDKADRRFCCHQCSVEATKRRSDVQCVQCGALFHPKTYTARFCSPSCVAKHKHATGILRHFPRKLTAERLDRLLAPRRPKRRYVQHLTPDRLDRLLKRVSRPG